MKAVRETDKFLLDRKLLQGITDYLITRPYGEVFQLLDAIRNIEPHQDQSPVARQVEELKGEG